MFQNIKVDIVYYKTNTDFELEFNLCGCCRMRLLTDKAPDKKTLVHNLARAVSRSRVIMISGKLDGEDGITDIIAHAISKTLTVLDNKTYGIKDDEKIALINGSTPLVTPEGEYGGCIIESGPQTMILLTEDKVIRKSVMHTLIHPYIEDLYAAELKPKSESTVIPAVTPAVSAEEPVISATDTEIPTEETAEEVTEEPTKETEEELQISEETEEEPTETPTEETSSPEEEENDGDIILSGGTVFEGVGKEESEDEQDEYVYEEISSEFVSEPEESEKAVDYDDEEDDYYPGFDSENRVPKFNANLPMLIISVLLLVILAVLCYCIFYVSAKNGYTATAYLQETFKTLFG